MGNDTSTHSSSNRMAISAMAHMMNLTKPQLLLLRDKCIDVSLRDGTTMSGYKMSRERFLQAMQDSSISLEPDYKVLEKLFTMWDKHGFGWVDCLTFLAGISPLATVMDVDTKLRFAIEVYDHKKTGRISRANLLGILQAINETASYFGDKVLQPKQIVVVVDDLFDCESRIGDDDTIQYDGGIAKLANHPFLIEFSSGLGSIRYGTAR